MRTVVTHFETLRGPDGSLIINASPVDTQSVLAQLSSEAPGMNDAARKIVASVGSWAGSAQGKRRIGGVFDRDRFLAPETTFEQIRVARAALDDDVVGGGADLTESLALSKTSIKVAADRDQQDAWNQWAAKVDLDSRMREAWQSLFSDSTFVMAGWWERQEFTVRGVSENGVPRRKKFSFLAPSQLTLLDSTKIVPVGTLLFNREHLAYIADPGEAEAFDRVLGLGGGSVRRGRYGVSSNGEPGRSAGLDDDELVRRLVRRRYQPTGQELADLAAEGIPSDNLFLLDNRVVWRHTLTRPAYKRFARVRLKSCFELLDQKAQLKQQDRALLIAGTSFIVLIRIGEKDNPAMPEELAGLQAGAHMIGQVPVITGDHRLTVDIISPSQDTTLKADRYDTIDVRLAARVFGSFVPTGADTSDPLKLGRVVGSSLESRRKMLNRSFERNLLNPIQDSNPELTHRAKMKSDPERIALSFDQGFAAFLLDLRESRDLSRETVLSQFGMDQADEAAAREIEADLYDDTFGTIVPHGANPDVESVPDTPTRLARRYGGRRGGGTRGGGGAAPGSGQGEETRDPRRSRSKVAAELDELSRDELIVAAGELDDPVPRRHRLRVEQLKDEILARLCPDEDVADE